ncbi:esterase/lipase superfamily enzyme [Halorubrum alkaliphilum]|uniref:Esterase/lipase superfamily enzyme n=1 Tax=Halorubrum alkaliphilum TaxID=261290 RepID=A0A8T4GCH0_9EURY|nr:esterase/lipase superfamily enzyme [Halorubrum alkaliphilum]
MGGAAGLGLVGGGGLYASRALDGDYGDLRAPGTQPVLSTRGRIDADGSSGSGTVSPSVEGSWEFDAADPAFLFVHGFSTGAEAARDQAYTAQVGIRELRPDEEASVVAYSWDSDVGWGDAKRTADANAEPLAGWLIDRADAGGGRVHLLGYSLGARVTGETLRVLDERGRDDVLGSVSLLGGAIPRVSAADDGRYGSAFGSIDAPVRNFHSRNDRVLGWVYRASDRTRAVGHDGLPDAAAAPAGYRDVDVTDLVGDHYSYFQPGEGCLPRVLDGID